MHTSCLLSFHSSGKAVTEKRKHGSWVLEKQLWKTACFKEVSFVFEFKHVYCMALFLFLLWPVPFPVLLWGMFGRRSRRSWMEEREGGVVQVGLAVQHGGAVSHWAGEMCCERGTQLLGFSLSLLDMESSISPLVTWNVSKITSRQL